jgi:hypothetical protein
MGAGLGARLDGMLAIQGIWTDSGDENERLLGQSAQFLVIQVGNLNS